MFRSSKFQVLLKYLLAFSQRFRQLQHLFGIRPSKEIDLEEVKTNLQKAKISVSVRGNAIRVSPNAYNTEAEMLKLTKVLSKRK